MSSFANLKRNSGSSLETLKKSVEALNTTQNYNKDAENYWKPEVDKSGNSFSIIRFLPSPPQDEGEIPPFTKFYDHGFKGEKTGLWYIEKSLTTLGQPDPLSEANSLLWNSGIESNKELARKQKRRLHYVSNIYVIKDSANPDNNGKVFLFVYGKKIMEKIMGAMNPQFEDDVAFDPFDLWTGANFKLKIRKVEGYQNYDLSEFDTPGPLFEDDEKMEEVWKSEHSLLEIIDPKNFKSYDELKKRYERVAGIVPSGATTVERAKSMKPEVKSDESSEVFEEDDTDLDYFKALLSDD